MEEELDQISNIFCNNLNLNSQPTWYNNSPFDVRYFDNEKRVKSMEFIADHAFIGFVPGRVSYTWAYELYLHFDSLIYLDDDYVIDTSDLYPKPVLTLINNSVESDNISNCVIIYSHGDCDQDIKCSMFATRNINPGDELVYDILHY